jgi:hypothetical protein
MERQADLVQVIGAGNTVGRRPHFLHGRQQQANEYGDDGDDHKQFNQRESMTLAHRSAPFFAPFATHRPLADSLQPRAKRDHRKMNFIGS